MPNTDDPFFEPYDRDEIAYGAVPSSAVKAFLDQVGGAGPALDLGAGAGRDTIALANAGYDVTAVDLSQRGLEQDQPAGRRCRCRPSSPNLCGGRPRGRDACLEICCDRGHDRA